MAPDPGKVYPQDLHLLQKELEAQGELLNQEIAERKADIERLRQEIEDLRELLAQRKAG